MKSFLFLVIACSFLGLGQLRAEEDQQQKVLFSHDFQPCNSWTYSSAVRGYICMFSAGYVSVPDYRTYTSDVQALQNQIRGLEDRIRKLEAGN